MKIKDEKELLHKLFLDVDSSNKKQIVFFSGHFPLIYTEEGAIEAIFKWGGFSLYTLELSCKVAKYALSKGKKVKFVFFVDDHMYEDFSKISVTKIKSRRNKLYKMRSGKSAKLLDEYRDIMRKYGFSEKDVILQNQGKKGREDCLYFSEKILRATKRKIDNPCAREYTEFIEDKKYFNKKESYLISFIPNRCKDNICHFALDIEIKGLSSSHVFLETMAKLSSKKEFYTFGRGVSYRKE